MVKQPKVFLLFLLLAALGWGCGAQPEPPAAEDSTPSPAAMPEPADGGPEPPSGGDIIVSPTGYQLDSNGTNTDITYSESTSMWIPNGFTGEVTEVSFDPGGGNPVIRFTGDVEIHFPSSAQIKITPGNPATWQCRATGTSAWAACTTQSGTTISSLFQVSQNNVNATVNAAGGTAHTIASGTSVTIK